MSCAFAFVSVNKIRLYFIIKEYCTVLFPTLSQGVITLPEHPAPLPKWKFTRFTLFANFQSLFNFLRIVIWTWIVMFVVDLLPTQLTMDFGMAWFVCKALSIGYTTLTQCQGHPPPSSAVMFVVHLHKMYAEFYFLCINMLENGLKHLNQCFSTSKHYDYTTTKW